MLKVEQVRIAMTIAEDMARMEGCRQQLLAALPKLAAEPDTHQMLYSGSGGGGAGIMPNTVMTVAFAARQHVLEEALQGWCEQELTKGELQDIYGIVLAAIDRGRARRAKQLTDMGIEPRL